MQKKKVLRTEDFMTVGIYTGIFLPFYLQSHR